MRSQDFNRSQRVADQIARAVATLLQSEVSDPRLRGVTVSGADLSPDLKNATIYITTPLGGDADAVLAGLARAAPYLRHCLSRAVRMKYLPHLVFKVDHTLDEVDRIERLLKDASDGEKR